ncbi:MAG: hypothetical protein HYZ53_03330 [Planctomycetes bacterium]|nr:hypothetical protein [Planctomycetota bacterium]
MPSLVCGSVASPNREREWMRDGADAVADRPILNALLTASSGASWVSVHHLGGVSTGCSSRSRRTCSSAAASRGEACRDAPSRGARGPPRGGGADRVRWGAKRAPSSPPRRKLVRPC